MSKRPNQGLSRYRSTTLPNASKISILPKQFSSIERIGSGLTAEVYSCKHSKFGNVCVKIIHNSFLKSSLGEKLINNEISILEKLQHDNVIKFYQTLKCNDKRAIVTQFCQGGDMQKQIKSRKKYKEKEALHIFSQIIDGCKYLLQKDIIHRDLKPANILLKSKGCQVKLADFGFAVKSSDIELMRKNVGSPLYMAPQALSDLKYTQKSEVFSLGILLYQMLTGKTPWTAVSERDLLLKIKTTKPVKITECTQKTWEKIILKCLQIDSFKRANLKQLSNTVNEVISELNGDYGKINSSKNYLNNSYEQYQKQSLQIYKKGGKYQNNSIKPLLPKLPNKNKNRKVITTDRPLKKQSDSQQAHQKIKIASKKSQRTISTSHKDQKAESRFFSSAQIVRKINPRSYSFLPQSLMMKFQFIIQKYDYIVSAERNCQKGQKQPYKPKPSYEIQKDLMIAEVWRCSEEKELCQIILGFVRRLLRLTKNYLNLDQKNNAGYLEMFYKRVTEIAQ